jgi:site-specific recombinase XerD
LVALSRAFSRGTTASPLCLANEHFRGAKFTGNIAWIKKYIQFHKLACRADLADGERKIEAYLTHLAVELNVSPATQNQAMNALVFLYKKVLKVHLDDEINAVRAKKKINIPVVLTREEAAQALMGHQDVSTTMIYTHVLEQGGQGVPGPLDDLKLNYAE